MSQFHRDGDKEAFLRFLEFRQPHQSHFRLAMRNIEQIRFRACLFLTRCILMIESEARWQIYMEGLFKAHQQALDAEGKLVYNCSTRRELKNNDVDFDSAEYC